MKGVEGIHKVLLRENKDNWFVNDEGEIEKNLNDKWILETDGSNFIGVLNVHSVDVTRTITNNI